AFEELQEWIRNRRGVTYVKEAPPNDPAAAKWERGAPNPRRARGEAPALRYANPFGGRYVAEFAGIGGTTLIDRKLAFYSSDKAKLALRRQSEALKQNPGYKLRIEVPTQAEKRRIEKYLKELRITNIEVAVP